MVKSAHTQSGQGNQIETHQMDNNQLKNNKIMLQIPCSMCTFPASRFAFAANRGGFAMTLENPE